MANPKKCEEIARKAISDLECIARGSSPMNLEDSVQKAYAVFLNSQSVEPFVPDLTLASNFTNTILMNIFNYSRFYAGRKIVEIAGGEREIATEEEAYESLLLAESIARKLIVPYFKKTNQFTNAMFKDIANLSYAYVDAIVDGVADDYIPEDKAYDAKSHAIDLAKQSARMLKAYNSKGLAETTRQEILKLEKIVEDTNFDFMRSFAVVSTTRKKIAHGKELMEDLIEKITTPIHEGRFEFEPMVIFPIAHGGTEFAVKLANVYEDKGHNPLVYPLFYSIKTRKHKYPWTENDRGILSSCLEGKNLLVVEDWVTTGNTLRGILLKLENANPKEIRIATIKRDPYKSYIPFLSRYQFYIGAETPYIGGKDDRLMNERTVKI